MSETYPWEQYPLHELEAKGIATLGRGNIISKKDIQSNPGGYPIYSSSAKAEGLFGTYGDYMFDEEMITWSVDGGGNLFYRPRHRFSVTNVSGYMRLDTSVLDYQFAHAALAQQHSKLTFDYQTKAHPSVIRNLYHLPIPPLPEQKKIAEILSEIDSLAQRIKSKVEKLEHAKNALIQNLCQDGAERWSALVNITDFVTSGSRGWSQYYSSKGAKFVRIGNLSRSSIDLDPTPEKWQLVDPPEGAEGARTKLEESDLLISITADLGICCIYSGSIGEAYINQHIALVRLAPDYGAYARQIAYYICSEHCQEQIRSMNDSGAKAGLNLDSIRKIRVPLMQDGSNNKIVQNIDALQGAISTNLVRLRHLSYEKNALLSDLLSGRKRVSV